MALPNWILALPPHQRPKFYRSEHPEVREFAELLAKHFRWEGGLWVSFLDLCFETFIELESREEALSRMKECLRRTLLAEIRFVPGADRNCRYLHKIVNSERKEAKKLIWKKRNGRPKTTIGE